MPISTKAVERRHNVLDIMPTSSRFYGTCQELFCGDRSLSARRSVGATGSSDSVIIKVITLYPGSYDNLSAEEAKAEAQLKMKLLKLSSEERWRKAHDHANICAVENEEVVVKTRILEDSDTTSHPATLGFLRIWYPDENILEYIKERPDANKLLLITQVARGIEHLHSCDLVHGNLHPGSIIINNKGEAMITDVCLDALAQNAATVVPLHPSDRYRAPEAVANAADSFVLTKPMDVYSWAITAYDIYGGDSKRHPDGRHKTERMVSDILTKYLPKPKSMSSDLYNLLIQCWNTLSDARPTMCADHRALSH